MKIYRLALLSFLYFTATPVMAQQAAKSTVADNTPAGVPRETSNFDVLYQLLKTQYLSKDYKGALTTVDALKTVVDAEIRGGKVDATGTTASNNFDALYSRATSRQKLTFGNDVLTVAANKDIYVSGDSPNNSGESLRYRDIFIGKIFVQFNGDDLIDDVYCKINGKTEMIHYSSSDPEVLTVNNHGDKDALDAGGINLSSAGDCIVTLTLAGKSLQIPIKLIKLPVYGGMSKDDFIKIMGLPDDKQTAKVEWPDKRFVDGVFYEPSAGSGTVYTEHWFYKKYPRIAFVVDGTDVILQIHDTGW